MKIIHNFSSQRYQKISTIDIALWHMSCLTFLSQGYKLKLYCERKDIKFLERNKLLQYYDEVDVGTFETTPFLELVNEDVFWFIRKIAAIDAEFECNPEPFVYSDTDLFIFKPIEIEDCDVLLWCLEDRGGTIDDNDLYCDWKYFSKPLGYEMPDYISSTTNTNYNSGLVYFKDKNLYRQYVKHVLDFIVDNPCEFTNETLKEVLERAGQNISRIWALNSEQRILTGFLNSKDIKVKVFDDSGLKSNGISESGAHYFMIRNAWNQIKNWDASAISLDTMDVIFSTQRLIEFKRFFFRTLEDNDLYDTLNFFKKKKQFKAIDRLEKSIVSSIKELNN